VIRWLRIVNGIKRYEMVICYIYEEGVSNWPW
jgi:hypothetical protein